MEKLMFLYFADLEMKKPLTIIEFGEISIGETAELVVYALNVTNAELTDIKFEPEDKDLEIIVSNKVVKPKQVIMLKFIFTPSEDRETALNAKMRISAVGHLRP